MTLSRAPTSPRRQRPRLPSAAAALRQAGAGRWHVRAGRLTLDAAAARLLGLSARALALARWLAQLSPAEAQAVTAALANAAAPLALELRSGPQAVLLRGTAAGGGWQGVVMAPPTVPLAGGMGALSARDEFVAGIGHELRTPLNAIVGFARLARAQSPAAAERRHVEAIEQAAHLMLRVVNDLLDLASLEAGRLEIEPDAPLDLPALAARVLAMSAALRQDKPIHLYTVLDPALPPMLRGDTQRIEQVLVNLAGNALKYTDRGMVELAARLRARHGDLVTVRLSVSDTGVGIPLDKLDRIGRPFERAGGTGRPQGAGLGLAVVRRLLELHGTQLKVASVAGGGTICWFDLTLGLDSAAPTPVLAAETAVFSADRRFTETVAALWRTRGQALLPMDRADEASRWVVDAALPEAAVRAEEARRQGREVHLAGAGPVASDGPAVGLPLLAGAVFDTESPDPLGQDPAIAGRRLLVVEDNTFNQRVLDGLLRHLGAVPVLCRDGASALQAAAATPFDAALLDIQLEAGESGFDVARALRRQPGDSALPLVFISAHLGHEERIAAAAVGALACLPKPYEPEALAALLRPLPRRGTADAAVPPGPALSLPTLFSRVWPAQRNALLQAADAQALRDAVHGLRGSLAMLGDRAAVALAREVEEGLIAGRPAAALPLQSLLDAAARLARG